MTLVLTPGGQASGAEEHDYPWTSSYGFSLLGWTEQQVLENYPTLTSDALRAVFAFAAECMGEEAMFTMPVGPAYAISG